MFFKNQNFFFFSIITACLFFLGGCQFLDKENFQKDKNLNQKETYYSISDFLDDQWQMLHGQPIVLLKVTDFNGAKDSAFVLLDSTEWKNIRKQFDPSDISNVQFLNQYQFSVYSEDALNQVFLNYQAKNNNLFTQSVNIGMDNYNHRIRSIFIETRAGNKTFEKTQKLTYIPKRTIRIQAFEKSIISKPEQLMVSYYFNY